MIMKNRGVVVADRNLVNYLKFIKENNPEKIDGLKDNIIKDNIKLVLLSIASTNASTFNWLISTPLEPFQQYF